VIAVVVPVQWPVRRSLALLVAVVGGYLTYVHPRRFRLRAVDWRIEGPTLWLLDALFHHLPLLVVVCAWWPHRRTQPFFTLGGLWLTILILTVYVSLFDVRRVYGLRDIDIIVLTLSISVFIVLAGSQ